MNCDGVVDSGDCTVMALAMTDPGVYGATYPGCPLENADLNGDGLIDCVDFPLFIAAVALTSPGGCGFMDCPLQTDAIFTVGDGPDSDVYPDVSCSEASTICLVVWQADTAIMSSIWGRFIGLDGVAFGEPLPISNASTIQSNPRVEHDPVRDRFLVVWKSDYAPTSADTDIYARFIPMGGADPGQPPFPISTTVDQQLFPRLAYAPGIGGRVSRPDHRGSKVSGEPCPALVHAGHRGRQGPICEGLGPVDTGRVQFDHIRHPRPGAQRPALRRRVRKR